MADDVEVAGGGHLALGREVGADEGLRVSAKRVGDAFREKFGLVVDRYAHAARDHLVDGADDVVEVEGGVDGPVGADQAGDEIGLDAAEDADAVLVLLGDGADIGHVVRHGVRLERPRIADRQEGVGGEANRVEALFNGGLHDVLGRVFAIAPG